jgi:flavin reductase (DIM6/NTAB) family NADH-FMN oxidoreductase RutF
MKGSRIMFNQIKPQEMKFNPFQSVGSDWMLVTAGSGERMNTMTASWGGVGVLWNRNVVTCYIRPQRYTRELMDEAEYFSLSFLSEQYRKQLAYLGTVSGRDEDKITGSGLTVCRDYEAPCFAEADTVLICKKIYVDEIKPQSILYSSIRSDNYPNRDYHLVYIGEIVKALAK